VPDESLRLTQNGKDLFDPVQNDSYSFDPLVMIRVELRGPLMGGKGGFGSLLRSMKPKTKEN